jgi:C1A family cysteine protease
MKLATFAVLFVLFGVALCNSLSDRKEFLDFMKKFNKKYAANEIPKKFGAFLENKASIAKLNADAKAKGLDTKFGYTKFSDLTAAEFKKYYLGYKPSQNPPKPSATSHVESHVEIPTSFDWGAKGAVTPVKDQGQCGSCWAFSATEGVESAWFMAGHALPVLAPQQIVDCDTSDDGCNGGDLPTAFAYVEKNGMEPEKDYPYTAEDGTCAYESGEVVAKITGWQYATQNGNETQMQIASMANGPLSICVDASSWQNYESGVYSECGTPSLDHCVQITGWGVSGDTPYWNVKNSWGTSWGQNGYIWVERGNDECGIAEEATYVIGSK